ncbi:FAD-dependent oxidoreductase [Pseudactinotalea suaedae]|uniref:FAD-dependent oxidoreductase n=1 Tax=Pseudactinotalea suaedae TaxID=1524924 RepID=UPI0013919F3E|nr:NAD(P)/FAD-dependent oxidoreductase [Pseudactinotalea suaedae]
MATPSELLSAAPPDAEVPIGLDALRREVLAQRRLIAYPETVWTPEDDRWDAVVIGGGQAGLTTAAKLTHEGVRRVLVLDRGPAGREGPWVTWARMETLRTAKDLHGPDAGIPGATFRSWYAAQHGEQAWERLGLIPREMWQTYLLWVRETFGIEVRNGCEVTALDTDGSTATLRVVAGGTEEVLRARAVVVATGTDGFGGPQLPPFVADLPRHRWIHSSGHLDVAALAGSRVAVLGAGASAFDNAAVALEAGAERVVQLVRRPALPTVNAARAVESRGVYRHFAALPERVRFELAHRFLSLPMPPPDHSVARCTRFEQYELRLGAAVVGAREGADGLELRTADGAVESFDLLVVATGFAVDVDAVPWLAPVAGDMARWVSRDVAIPTDPMGAALARYPVLDATMRVVGRDAAASERLRNLYLFGPVGWPSVGPQCTGINSLPIGSDTVVRGVCAGLLADQAERLLEDFDRATKG